MNCFGNASVLHAAFTVYFYCYFHQLNLSTNHLDDDTKTLALTIPDAFQYQTGNFKSLKHPDAYFN